MLRWTCIYIIFQNVSGIIHSSLYTWIIRYRQTIKLIIRVLLTQIFTQQIVHQDARPSIHLKLGSWVIAPNFAYPEMVQQHRGLHYTMKIYVRLENLNMSSGWLGSTWEHLLIERLYVFQNFSCTSNIEVNYIVGLTYTTFFVKKKITYNTLTLTLFTYKSMHDNLLMLHYGGTQCYSWCL
jgi:hypothetical protein